MGNVHHIEKDRRLCPHCDQLDALFDRVRRIEILLAWMLGASGVTGVGVAKLLGVF